MLKHEPEAAVSLPDYVVEDQVGFLLRRAHQRHTALFLAGMAEFDLTATQFTALIKIVELGHVTQNHLGRLTAMDPATIQGVVRRLQLRGLVASGRDPADKRTVVLTPTQAGLDVAARATGAAREITAATLAGFRPPEQRQLLDLLRRLG